MIRTSVRPPRFANDTLLATSLALLIPLSVAQSADSVPRPFISQQTPRLLQNTAGSASHSRVTARWADAHPKQLATSAGWQTRSGGESERTSQSAPAPMTTNRITRSISDTRQPSETVRLVSQIEPLDPFEDPFGDRSPPPVPAMVRERPSSSNELPTFTQSEQPDPVLDQLRGGEPAPLPPLESADSPSDVNCDRVYNQRNCCTVEDSCKTARDYLKNSSLRNISIDITPQLTVGLSNNGDRSYDDELERKLASAPSRLWRDRRGSVVADGHLSDFRDGRVVIRKADGSMARIPFAQLSEDDTCFVTAWWSIPAECTMGDDSFADRNWIATTMTWKASALCHKPLYFEDVQLERYGHSAGPFVQPVASGAHFFLNVAALPYKMGINPPNECQYALGYYRPGNCAPWLLPPIPLSVRGALAQAGAIAGGVFILP